MAKDIPSRIVREPYYVTRGQSAVRYTLTYSEGTFEVGALVGVDLDIPSRIVREQKPHAWNKSAARYTLTYSEGT